MFTPPPSPAPFLQGSSRTSFDVNTTTPESSRSPSPTLGSLTPVPPPRSLRPIVQTALSPISPVQQLRTPAEIKKRTGARTKWMSLLAVPFALILITASTRLLSHPTLLNTLSNSAADHAPGALWHFVTRRNFPQEQNTPPAFVPRQQQQPPPSEDPSAIFFPTPSSTFSSSTSSRGSAASDSPTPTPTGAPTIPPDSAPPTLPTPFPQALDRLASNFSTLTCSDFFTNMTQTAPFRACRPFSLLLGSSEAFADAQSNATLLNTVLWGTCHTTVQEDQCVRNMDWFAESLKSECREELAARNQAVVDTLIGLQTYPLMRTAGCLAAKSSNAYCFLTAALSPDPSDMYMYNLPLGLAYPAAVQPTCTACAKSLLALYGAALAGGDTSSSTSTSTSSGISSGVGSGVGGGVNVTSAATVADGGRYAALKSVYERAQSRAKDQCGAEYGQTTAAASSDAPKGMERPHALVGALALGLLLSWGALGVW